MKYIIDIPEEVLDTIKSFKGKFICKNGYDLIQGVKNGIPFDFVIEDIKAEIAEPIQEDCYYVGTAKIQAETIKWCLEVIDKYISGKEFSFPEREKGDVTCEELMQVCDKQADLIEKLGAYTKAYTDICEALQGRLDELEHETELLEADLQDGVRGYGMNRKCFEVRVKKELLRDIICFMTQALEDAKEGRDE